MRYTETAVFGKQRFFLNIRSYLADLATSITFPHSVVFVGNSFASIWYRHRLECKGTTCSKSNRHRMIGKCKQRTFHISSCAISTSPRNHCYISSIQYHILRRIFYTIWQNAIELAIARVR